MDLSSSLSHVFTSSSFSCISMIRAPCFHPNSKLLEPKEDKRGWEEGREEEGWKEWEK